MKPPKPVEVPRVERLHDWFDLQLILVETLHRTLDVPFYRAVTHYTNFHRRFGFGRPAGDTCSSEWRDFVEQLEKITERPDRVWLVKEFGRHRIISDRPEDRPEFGCFNFDPPNEHGIVRIHFAANDQTGGRGPLSSSKSAVRMVELRDMFGYVREHHGLDAKAVAGASWLYNLEAYRRLFPPGFVASRNTYQSPTMTLAGMPFWGQFLDHRENLRPDAQEHFLRNLGDINFRELWRLFPMPVMLTRAPLEEFYRHYNL